MEDWGNGGTNSSSYDIGGYNAVRVPYTQCGCVYGIASPDNISYFPDIDMLLIAEDTDYHQNENAWAYDFKTGSLTRFLTMPYGAEVWPAAQRIIARPACPCPRPLTPACLPCCCTDHLPVRQPQHPRLQLHHGCWPAPVRRG